jgi:hypothetical protein
MAGARTRTVTILTRKAASAPVTSTELSPVHFDVLRLVAGNSSPPASASFQVEKLVRLDLMFRGKAGYKLTAVGRQLIESHLSPTA